jgi:hypothetical protein
MRNKIYLGLYEGGKREIFRSKFEPTHESHGARYLAVIGPFRTMRGAIFMRDYGRANPHCQCVADAERLGKKYAATLTA